MRRYYIIKDINTWHDAELRKSLTEWNWFTNSKCHRWFVAYEDTTWLAYAAVSIYDRETVYLGPDFVAEHARGQSLQYKLILKRLGWATRRDYKHAISVVDCVNIYSANNYIRAGFTLRKQWPGFDIGSQYLWFTKELFRWSQTCKM